MKIRILSLLLLSVLSGTALMAQDVKIIARTVVGTDPLGDTGEKFGSLNGKSHQNDAVVTHNGWQYTAYYNDRSPRKIVLARRKLPSTRWEKFVYRGYNQTTNDGHNVISIGKAPHDGTLHLSFDHHGSELNYLKSVRGILNNPESKKWDNSAFGSVTANLGFGKIRGVTYPIFATAPNGNLYLSRRQGSPKVGDQILYEYKNSKWNNIGKYIEGNQNNAYMDNLYIDHNGRMHAAWIWRNTASVQSARDICYAYSDDYGRNWFDSNDKKVGTRNNGAMSHDDDPSLTAVPVARGQMTNQEGMTVDRKGRPHVVHRVNTTVHHFYQDSEGKWHQIDTKLRAKSRASIIADKDHNIYIVFADLKIARATEKGNYRDWKEVNTELVGTFTGDPLVDRYRMLEDNVLSVYQLSDNFKSCDIVDFDLGSTNEPQNNPPTATIVEPSLNSIEEGYDQLSFLVNASDPDGDDISLEMSVDGNVLRTERSAPYEWGHVSTNPVTETELLGLSIGSHVFEIKISDDKGASTTVSKTILVTEKGVKIYGPIHDAYIEGSNGKNDQVLRLEDNRRTTYLQFNAPEVPSGFQVLQVTLDLTVETDFGGGTISVYNSSDVSWTENNISANDAPQARELLSQLSGPFETGNTYSFDVTDFSTTNGKLTFVLESDGTGAEDVSFASKESTAFAAPSLRVKTDRVTSVNASINASGIQLFPNPSEDGMFHLSQDMDWEILDMNGLLLKSGSSIDIDLTDNAAGIYLLRVGSETIKLVRN